MGHIFVRGQWSRSAIAVSWRSQWRYGLLCQPRTWSIIRGVRLFASESGGVLSGSRPGPGPRDGSPPGQPVPEDHIVFEQLFTRHSPALFEYLCGMTHGDRELASDLVQETFLRAYGARVALADIERPHAWLFRIATNLALTTRRRRPISWVSLDAVEPQPGADSSDQWRVPRALLERSQDVAAEIAERDSVWRALTELPPRWRAALLLQTTSGFSTREIAALLGLSEANVRKLIFRAKERFRAIYLALDAQSAQEGGHA
jgi:RNA polymerase sigma-70 factor (ECF subfamily)